MRAAVLLGGLDGLAIALLAVGIVLVYKAERFVNFALAQLGVVSSLLLAKLVVDDGVNWWLAFVVAAAVGTLIGAACRMLIISRLENASRTALLIATIGLSQVLLALTFFRWLGPNRDRLRQGGYPLPFRVHSRVDALTLTGQHVLIAIFVPLLALALAIGLKRTIFGKAMRAAATNPDAARLAGIDIRRTSTAAWAIAGALSAVSAILASPGQAVLETQATGPTLLLRAVGAAALGGFTSLPTTFAAGIGLGIIEGVAVHFGHSTGVGEATLFVAILIGLVVRARIVNTGVRAELRLDHADRPLKLPATLARHWLVRRRVALLVGVGLVCGIVAPYLPLLRAPHRQFILAQVLAYAMVGASLTLLSGWAGQISLGQFAFVGLGAFTAARLAPHGWSMPAAMLVAGVVGACFAVVVGLPALRLKGLTLAVTTLGLAVVGPVWLFRQPWIARTGATSVPPAYVAGLGRLSTQRSVYFAALVSLGVTALVLSRLRRSNTGNLVVAVRDNDAAAAVLGFSPTVVRLATFALSGFVAAAAGVVWLAANRNVSVEVLGPHISLLILSIVVIGGLTSISGAVVGSIVIFGVPELLSGPVHSVLPNTLQFQLLLSGGGLLLTQIANPGGIAAVARRGYERLLDRVAGEIERAKALAPVEREMALSVRDLRVSYGGVHAVDGASLDVAPGEVVGLIGANGAGKSTLLDAVSGLLRPESGRVVVFGREVTQLGPDLRAHLGMSRGFQDSRLFPGLTVRETLKLALSRQAPSGLAGVLGGAPWVRFAERRLQTRAEEFIARFGLSAWADTPLDDLSTGTRHICDLATQMATEPRLVLLDEPTSGVAQRETEAFRPIIRGLAEQHGCAVLLVEHDMPLMLSTADRVYCLEMGRVIAEGTPAEIRSNPEVVASYLGSSVNGGVTAQTVPSRRRSRAALKTREA